MRIADVTGGVSFRAFSLFTTTVLLPDSVPVGLHVCSSCLVYATTGTTLPLPSYSATTGWTVLPFYCSTHTFSPRLSLAPRTAWYDDGRFLHHKHGLTVTFLTAITDGVGGAVDQAWTVSDARVAAAHAAVVRT